MEVSTQFNNSLLFSSDRGQDGLSYNLLSSLKTGLVFGIIGLGSFFTHSNIEKVSNVDAQLLPNSIHNVQISNEEYKMNIPFTSEKQKNTAIIDMNKKEESEVLDMDELRQLQTNFNSSQETLNRYIEKSHEGQIKITEQLATLNAEMKANNKELLRLNTNQDELPTLIRDEFKKIQQ